MALLPEGTRFPMLRHMLANPLRIVLILGAMAVPMTLAMMMGSERRPRDNVSRRGRRMAPC